MLTLTSKVNNSNNLSNASTTSSNSTTNSGDGLDLVEAEDKHLIRDLLSVMAKRGLGKMYDVKLNSKGYDILTYFPDAADADIKNAGAAGGSLLSTERALVVGGNSASAGSTGAAAASDTVTVYLDDLELLYEVNRLRVRSVAVKYIQSLRRLCVHVAVLSHKEPVMLEEQTVVMHIHKRKRWGLF